MNNRILELARQATIQREEYFPGDDGHPTITSYFDKEKFAELIAKDCMDICDDVTRQFGQFTFTAATAKARIAHRFGVDNKN